MLCLQGKKPVKDQISFVRLGVICWYLTSPNKQKRNNCEDENHDHFKDCRWRRVTSLFFQLPYHIDAINRQAAWWVSRFLRKERWFKRSSCFQNRSSIHKKICHWNFNVFKDNFISKVTSSTDVQWFGSDVKFITK